MAAAASAFTPAQGPLAPRGYVVLVSGTFNPPHRGHVRLGLRAAAALEAEGHTISSIHYVPVHDNYMFNKAASAASPFTVFPMERRCALLQALVDAEDPKTVGGRRCVVSDYEGTHGSSLLQESPHYWAAKLPDGYLKTCPTAALIEHFATEVAARENTRVALAFGVDNLAGMASWNSPERLLTTADIVLVARGMESVVFTRDPSDLLSAVGRLEARTEVSVVYGDENIFRGALGSFESSSSSSDGVMFLLGALEGDDESLSSTWIRSCLAPIQVASIASAPALFAATAAEEEGGALGKAQAALAKHGYAGGASLEALLDGAVEDGGTVLRRMVRLAMDRGEHVEGSMWKDWVESSVA